MREFTYACPEGHIIRAGGSKHPRSRVQCPDHSKMARRVFQPAGYIGPRAVNEDDKNRT